MALLSALAVAALLICLWLVHYLDLLGLRARDEDKAQLFTFFILLALTLAWFMGTSLQVLRRRFPAHWPAWSWPAVVIVTLLVVGFGIYRMLSL